LSPHRLGRELADLAEVLGAEREATLMVEISKRFERAVLARLGELATCSETERPRGEYIVVIGPPAPAKAPSGPADQSTVQGAYEEAVDRGLGRREAIRDTARRFGIRQTEVFDALKNTGRKPGGTTRS